MAAQPWEADALYFMHPVPYPELVTQAVQALLGNPSLAAFCLRLLATLQQTLTHFARSLCLSVPCVCLVLSLSLKILHLGRWGLRWASSPERFRTYAASEVDNQNSVVPPRAISSNDTEAASDSSSKARAASLIITRDAMRFLGPSRLSFGKPVRLPSQKKTTSSPEPEDADQTRATPGMIAICGPITPRARTRNWRHGVSVSLALAYDPVA
ncbi:hypothetical protein CDEST_01081 [Colletotrichum destructivum]|uniref:Uncharacterized protein n=1 Tax=Colletotrichum destructivum TaxID=34406 RepID=A0AAX4HZ42_9PEZI|nr:hypothetical protein CDEST_01081 [Colletotrichum destructivum]